MNIKNILSNAQALLSFCTFTICSISFAQDSGQKQTNKPIMTQKVDLIIDQDKSWLEKTFIDIHQNPELGFMEKRTSNIVSNELKKLGFEVKTGIGQTGVVAILKNGHGPTVMYRADMDANEIEEHTGLPYASTKRVTLSNGVTSPVAHMCGHDAHITWMLGMARAMVKIKNDWRGTLILIGQPAEELIMGAQAMIDDGLWTKYDLPRPDYFLAMHSIAAPVGTIINAAGPRMAGTDQVDILFKGSGGHGSTPHFTKDPILMAAYAITQFQSIPSQLIDAQKTAVLTIGSIQAGKNNNVIPSEALIQANLRWYDLSVREKMISAIKNTSHGIARIYGISEDKLPEVTIKGSSTPLINDPTLSQRLSPPLKRLLGENNVITDFPTFAGSEDVHLLKGPHLDLPFSFLFVGVADPKVYEKARQEGKLTPYVPHSPYYIVDLKALPVGTKIATTSILELMD